MLTPLKFDQVDLCARLDALGSADLDALEFGVIGIDAATVVRLYNAFESQRAGIAPSRMLDRPLFTVAAPCMNNYLVAQRFADALAANVALDVTLDYVLTAQMRPVKVRLRLLAAPGAARRYVAVQWAADRVATPALPL